MLLLLACTQDAVLLGAQTTADPSVPAGDQPINRPSGNADWYVGEEADADFDSIQDAINAASNGDWILVYPGEYREALDFNGKSLWITGAGAETTIIDGGSSSYAVAAAHGETSATGLVGFTIRGGRSATVYVEFASLHLEDSVVDTSANYGLYGTAADLELQGVTVTGSADYAMLSMSRGSLQMNDTDLTCGGTGTGLSVGHGYLQVDWSSIRCSRGNAISDEHTTGSVLRTFIEGNLAITNEDDHPTDSIDLINSVLIGNYTAYYGTLNLKNSFVDGLVSFTPFLEDGTPGVPVIENTILSGERAGNACAFSSDAGGVGATMIVRNSNFWGTSGVCDGVDYTAESLQADPEFVDYDRDDFHLSPGSPLIDAGLDEDVYDDIDGSRNDIGPYGSRFSLDGGW